MCAAANLERWVDVLRAAGVLEAAPIAESKEI